MGTSGSLGGRQPGIPAAPPGTSREVPSDLLGLLDTCWASSRCSAPRGASGGIEGAGSLAGTSWELGCRLQLQMSSGHEGFAWPFVISH